MIFSKNKNTDEHHHQHDEVVCFTSQGREICVRASELEHIFKKGKLGH